MDAVFSIESYEGFKAVAEELLNNLYCPESKKLIYLSPNIINTAKKDLKALISDCKFETKELANLLKDKDWDKERVCYFFELLENKKTDLLSASLNNLYSAFGEIFTNFDWYLKLIYGSSELKTSEYPLLQLCITSVEHNGQENKLSYDVNKITLSKMITALEKIDSF